jgi:hypothetical protein
VLLHLNFCIEWFDSNSKEDSKSFGKWLWKIGKKEKREGNPILFGFWPSSARALCLGTSRSQPSSLHVCRVRLPPRCQPRRSTLLPAHGPSPAVGPARAAFSFPLSLSGSHFGPACQDQLPPHAVGSVLSKITTHRILPLNLFLSYLERLRAI